MDLKELFPPATFVSNKRVNGLTILPNDEIVMSVYYEPAGFGGPERALIRTDGEIILDDRSKNFDYEHFRLSPSGEKLMASDGSGVNLSLNRIFLSDFSHDSFFNGTLGTANSYLGETSVYAVSDDNENTILIPNQENVIPALGNVTSIDY